MRHIFTLVLVATALVSCNKKGAIAQETASDSLQPVEIQEANTDYQPAFKEQTRAPGVTTTTPYQGVVVTEALTAPWGVVSLPDGRLLITENQGVMRIVDASTGELSETITGLPEVDDRGQGGLLGLTLAPDFLSNKMVYWVFSEKVASGNHTAVAKGRLADRSEERRVGKEGRSRRVTDQ